MDERVGYIGRLDDKYKIFYDGREYYYTTVNGMALTLDWITIPAERKQRLC